MSLRSRRLLERAAGGSAARTSSFIVEPPFVRGTTEAYGTIPLVTRLVGPSVARGRSHRDRLRQQHASRGEQQYHGLLDGSPHVLHRHLDTALHLVEPRRLARPRRRRRHGGLDLLPARAEQHLEPRMPPARLPRGLGLARAPARLAGAAEPRGSRAHGHAATGRDRAHRPADRRRQQLLAVEVRPGHRVRPEGDPAGRDGLRRGSLQLPSLLEGRRRSSCQCEPWSPASGSRATAANCRRCFRLKSSRAAVSGT